MSLTTGAQLRAARALADLEQAQLAATAGVATGTVYRLERDRGLFKGVRFDTVRALQQALEEAGVTFTDDGGVVPGVKLQRAPA
jgi:transcriptional regulator with XRE-family HTH domain